MTFAAIFCHYQHIRCKKKKQKQKKKQQQKKQTFKQILITHLSYILT